jgi:hypothetical protein
MRGGWREDLGGCRGRRDWNRRCPSVEEQRLSPEEEGWVVSILKSWEQVLRRRFPSRGKAEVTAAGERRGDFTEPNHKRQRV